GTHGDESTAHHQCDDDADQQHLLLIHPWHGEGGHDDQEYEQVVHRECFLGDEAGVVLAGEGAAPLPGDHTAEGECQADVHGRPERPFAEGRFVRGTHEGEEIENEQAEDHHDGDPPHESTYLHAVDRSAVRVMTTIMPDMPHSGVLRGDCRLSSHTRRG